MFQGIVAVLLEVVGCVRDAVEAGSEDDREGEVAQGAGAHDAGVVAEGGVPAAVVLALDGSVSAVTARLRPPRRRNEGRFSISRVSTPAPHRPTPMLSEFTENSAKPAGFNLTRSSKQADSHGWWELLAGDPFAAANRCDTQGLFRTTTHVAVHSLTILGPCRPVPGHSVKVTQFT